LAATVETENNMSAIITLTTDLGLTDAYVSLKEGSTCAFLNAEVGNEVKMR